MGVDADLVSILRVQNFCVYCEECRQRGGDTHTDYTRAFREHYRGQSRALNCLNEIVQFLDSLYEVDLPSKIENVRVNLLQRSKTKLSTFIANRDSTSPEPYLDMNAGKGLLLFTKKKNTKETEIEEYVGVEEQPNSISAASSHQDYYESFQEIDSNNDETSRNEFISSRRSKSWRKFAPRDDQVDNKLHEIYKTFTVTKTMSTALKCGPLYHKVEKKPFGFVRGNVRLCWIGLVGSHLLIYGSEDDRQPPEICSIRGYSARAAPNALPRDPERAKSAFEIFCPGNKTLQFIARTPREMEEWLAVINRTTIINQPDKDEYLEKENVEKKRSEEPESPEEKYQDVGEVLPTPKIHKNSPIPEMTNSTLEISNDKDRPRSDRDNPSRDLTISPPALPVRIPRRLPSLPSKETAQVVSYEPLDDAYEEDDIYHKIEDFRENGGRSYENVKKSRESSRIKKITKTKKRKRKDAVEAETYDDVENKNLTKNEKTPETYDDVRKIDANNPIETNNSSSSRRDNCESLVEISRANDETSMNYDDVFQVSSSVPNRKIENCESKKSTKSTTSSPSSSPTKSPHKRSFLDRVRHRKDSPKKEEKKRSKEAVSEKKKSAKIEKIIILSDSSLPVQPTSSIGSNLNLPTYDDVSELVTVPGNCQITNQRSTIFIQTEDEMSNYNSPPPPRPIYAKRPSNALVSTIKNDEKTRIDEVYDDIENYRKVIADGNEKESQDKSNLQEKVEISMQSKDPKIEMAKKYENRQIDVCPSLSSIEISGQDGRKASLVSEHYQTPRADSLQIDRSIIAPTQEELYDDIAILADFRAKQRESASSSSSPKKLSSSFITHGADKLTISVRKPWNRFGSGKKINSRDIVLPQGSVMKNKSSTDLDEIVMEDNILPSPEKHETSKLNKLQKFINKIESTVGKQPSTKSVGPI